MDAREIKPSIYWVGVKDWNRRIFDALIPLPQGTSYNSYLVKGKEKTALIDTVNPGFEEELAGKVNQVEKLTDIDYVIMNHAEPDHAGAIPYILQINSKAMLIATDKGIKMAQIYYHVSEERMIRVKEGDRVELGGKSLQFIEAPWLHWPETMFTYLVEDKVLFPCDFFGSHTAFGFYDEDIEEIIPLAKRYFGEIMMPFRRMGEKALEKIKDSIIEIIAPSHGPIYKNTERIIEHYRKWTTGETKKKVIILYCSMWGSTEAMIKTMVDTLMMEGVAVCVYDLLNVDVGAIAKDLVDSAALVLGAPTVMGGLHPLGIYAAYLIKTLRPPLKYCVILSSYGWGAGAVRQAKEILGPIKVEIVGTLEVNGPASANDLQQIKEIGRQLAHRIAGEVK